MSLLELLFLDFTQRQVLACTALFLTLSWAIGRGLRLGGLLAPAFGFLLLCAAATLAMLGLRQTGASLTWFGPLVLAGTVALVLALRMALPPLPAAPPDNRAWLIAVSAILIITVWSLRIIQLDPSASLSSHHGWYPLYIEGSFQIDRFGRVEDFAFGNGYLASISYGLDLMGLVALGKWFGPFSAWHAYSAASTLAALLSLCVLAEALRASRAALVCYGLMVLALLAGDFLYRTTMARNWGDAMLYLGGAVMLVTLTQGQDIRRRALWTAAASLFLVVGRHYGAFYSGLIMIAGYGATWRLQRQPDLRPWLGLGIILLILSSREIACILAPPSPYYPGSKLLEVAAPPQSMLLSGTLNDLGVLTDGHLAPTVIGLRNLYLLAALVLTAIWWRQRTQRLSWLATGLLPLALAALPQILQYLTQYRSSHEYSKTTLVAIHLFAWYPAYVLGRVTPLWRWRPSLRLLIAALVVGGGIAVTGGTVVLTAKAGIDLRQGPSALLNWAFTRYRDHNVDLNIARLMREQWNEREIAEITARPVLYLHYEPGLGLRNFMGGQLFCDLDFWGPTVQQAADASSSLPDLIARLGYPSIYLSYGDSSLYSRYQPQHWNRFAAEFASIGTAQWIERSVTYRTATLLVPKRPADAPFPKCPTAADHQQF
ncbi:hypothetical protein [Magnetospirillum sulfuroxidans]|uniref:Glycosyltransferase RgtA/B/C/D-like domain-containing protein n=1 Tax=Magnetospirillum sulfuroxidans TaxID=611300 RepID=A0ABS5IHJ2_9PROT|nr:hypothetical protein [Magnetospirillum sulfuroxidans]MBR9973896.1 hypothetical protein [Magnetospirillum sulfuroxidans]